MPFSLPGFNSYNNFPAGHTHIIIMGCRVKFNYHVNMLISTHCIRSKIVGRQFSPQQRAFMVGTFIETNSVARTRQRFALRFPNIPIIIPCTDTVRRNLRKYHSHGTSQSLNPNRLGRLRTGIMQPNIRPVRQSLQSMGVSHHSVWEKRMSCVWKLINNFHTHKKPFKMHNCSVWVAYRQRMTIVWPGYSAYG